MKYLQYLVCNTSETLIIPTRLYLYINIILIYKHIHIQK